MAKPGIKPHQSSPLVVLPQSHTVGQMVPGGRAMVRLQDGRPCFVSGAFLGDQIRLLELTDKRSFAEASRWELEAASPARQPAACPLAARCGGCDWMGIEYTAQLNAKREILRDALRRTASFECSEEDIQLIPSPEQLSYRTRIRLRMSSKGELGLYGRRSHEIVPIRQCAVTVPKLQRALSTLQSLLDANPSMLSGFQEVEIRATPTRPSLCLFAAPKRKTARPKNRPRSRSSARVSLKPEHRQQLEQHFLLRVAQSGADREKWDTLALNESLSLKVPPGGFTQVNWQINQSIIQELVSGTQKRKLHSFIDVYCGAGNFTLPLLARQLVGVGIEGDRSLVAGARQAARDAGLPPEAFVHEDAGQWAHSEAANGTRVDLVVCDPPRSGVKFGLEELAQLTESWLFMCACDPVTFARDLKRLQTLGFQPEQLSLYDMFPQTHHFEVTCWFRAP